MGNTLMSEVPEHLSEDPSMEGSEEEYESDNEELLFKNQEGSIHDFGEDFNQLDYELSERNKDIDLELDKDFVFDPIETEVVPAPEEVVEELNPTYEQQLERLKKLVQAGKQDPVRDMVVEERGPFVAGIEQADTEKEKSEDNVGGKSKRMHRNIGLALFGVISLAGTALYFLLKWLNSNKETSDQFTPEDAANAEKLIKGWKTLEEGKFWARIAEYTEKNNPSFEFQMQMVGYIKVFASDKGAPKFKWTAKQKLDAIDQLVNAFTSCPDKKGKKSAAIYKALVGIKPDNRQLPRSIAADITEFAIAGILALGNAQKQTA